MATRNVLNVDELPSGAVARYQRDVQVNSYVIGKRNPVVITPDYIPVDTIKNYINGWTSNARNNNIRCT